MTRIEIFANTVRSAEDLASLLSADERLEVMQARAAGASHRRYSGVAEVLVTLGLDSDQIPTSDTPVVAIAERSLVRAFSNPAVHAALPMNSSPAEIAAAILGVAGGYYTLTRAQFQRLQPPANSDQQTAGILTEKLTARELEVLSLMADGLVNKEIAAALGISDHTVKFHAAQVLAKLAVSSRTEAVRVAIRRGLIAI